MIKRVCGNCWYWNPNKPEPKKCKGCGELRNNFYPRELTCSVCGEQMIMYEFEYAICDGCGTRTDPFYKKVREDDSIREEFEKQLPCQRNTDKTHGTLVTVHSKLNGGSKTKGSKKPVKKKSTTQTYNELAASGNKIKYAKQ